MSNQNQKLYLVPAADPGTQWRTNRRGSSGKTGRRGRISRLSNKEDRAPCRAVTAPENIQAKPKPAGAARRYGKNENLVLLARGGGGARCS
jgi:hypothetical protein